MTYFDRKLGLWMAESKVAQCQFHVHDLPCPMDRSPEQTELNVAAFEYGNPFQLTAE